jgi:hypothetical protein
LLFKAQQYRKNPFAEAYISLINATIPFQDVFSDTEKGLRGNVFPWAAKSNDLTYIL